MGLAGHHLGEIALVAAEASGDDDGGIVRGFGHHALDGILDRDGVAGLETELGGRLDRGVLGNRQRRVELDLAGLEPLEQQVERHDLGQRGRVAQFVGACGM